MSNLKRLATVVVALRDAQRNQEMVDKFTMQQYGYASGSDDEHSCGTPACAFGHYVARTDLQDTFRLGKDGDPLYIETATQSPMGAGLSAANRHFRLEGEGSRIFDADGCDNAETPGEAADFIQSFIIDELAAVA